MTVSFRKERKGFAPIARTPRIEMIAPRFPFLSTPPSSNNRRIFRNAASPAARPAARAVCSLQKIARVPPIFCFFFPGERKGEGEKTIQLARDRLRYDVRSGWKGGREVAPTVCRRVTIIIYQEIQSLFSTLRIVQSVKRYLRRDRG